MAGIYNLPEFLFAEVFDFMTVYLGWARGKNMYRLQKKVAEFFTTDTHKSQEVQ